MKNFFAPLCETEILTPEIASTLVNKPIRGRPPLTDAEKAANKAIRDSKKRLATEQAGQACKKAKK